MAAIGDCWRATVVRAGDCKPGPRNHNPRVGGLSPSSGIAAVRRFSSLCRGFAVLAVGGSDPNGPQRTPQFLTILSPACPPGATFPRCPLVVPSGRPAARLGDARSRARKEDRRGCETRPRKRLNGIEGSSDGVAPVRPQRNTPALFRRFSPVSDSTVRNRTRRGNFCTRKYFCTTTFVPLT
jgi:hypothetical protein